MMACATFLMLDLVLACLLVPIRLIQYSRRSIEVLEHGLAYFFDIIGRLDW